MRLLIILIAFCMARESLQRVKFQRENTISENHVLCVNLALETYISDDQNLHIFSRKSNVPVKSLLKYPHFLVTEWNLLRELLYVGRGPLVIFLEGDIDDDFSGFKRLQGIATVHPVLIVCITNVVCSSDNYMEKIIEIVTGEVIQYVAVDERGMIYIYEYTKTAEGSCGTAQLSKRGLCSDASTAKKVLQMAINFQKCPLRVIASPSPALLADCNPDGHSILLCGIEEDVVKILAQKINGTPVIQTVITTKDVRQHAASRGADLGIGGLDSQAFEGVLYSKPYMFVQATVVAPLSTWTLERSLGNIFRPFESEVWVGIGLVMVSVIVLRLVVPHFQRIHPHQLFGIFLGFPVPRPPRSLSSSRVYFISWVLFGYFCSQSYLTNLTKVLTTPRREMIRTLRDLEKSKLRVAGSVAIWKKFEDDYPRIYKDFLIEDHEDYYAHLLEVLRGRSSSVYYVEDLDSNIAAWTMVKGLRDRINWYPVTLVAPNTSAVLRTANKLLPWIWESGMLKASSTFSSPNGHSLAYWNHTSSQQLQPRGLQVKDLMDVFILLIGGLILSLSVFFVEIITALIKKRIKLKGRVAIQTEISRPERVERE